MSPFKQGWLRVGREILVFVGYPSTIWATMEIFTQSCQANDWISQHYVTTGDICTKSFTSIPVEREILVLVGYPSTTWATREVCTQSCQANDCSYAQHTWPSSCKGYKCTAYRCTGTCPQPKSAPLDHHHLSTCRLTPDDPKPPRDLVGPCKFSSGSKMTR